MNLKPDQLKELNLLLSKEDLDLPSTRSEVGRTGQNLQWLKRTLSRTEQGSPRLRELLEI